ncbi:hypothetical protein [Virgibacillus sediminis]|uniref:YvrJ family protein n=1 Tax=Virgibacillus sediminis TaxID=202260 RepID=A0ABV7A9G4_9BACI
MWATIVERLPTMIELICTILAFAIPYTVYKVNRSLRESGDPAWKKAEQQK